MHPLPTPDVPTGLVVLRASRLEALIPPLQRLLEETRPPHPLVPQTLIAAHPGMKAWLTGALAREVGPARIVANLRLQLPSDWLDGLSTRLLGEQAVALPRYRRGPLRWVIHGLLGDPGAHRVSERRLRDYLAADGGADARALRRFQLADRLSRVFSQYLVYRSDWLDAWEAGKSRWATAALDDPALRALEAEALAPLWRAVVERLGDHRGRVVRSLVDALGRATTPLPPLHAFGLSHLAPSELAVLRAYARRALVCVYVPDPCREFWGGLHRATPRGDGRAPDVEAWRRFRDDEAARLADPDALDWREQGHPLLARWGRLGQHFFAALADDGVREDIRHWADGIDAPPASRLARLQEGIRQLRPELMREAPSAAEALGDSSFRVHACHTRLRELEVLRDALLDAVDRDGIAPGAMVVMAPDLGGYLPLIPAVFGAPGSTRERRLPYHLADVPVARSHPLSAAFETLLALGTTRLTAPEVADLLGVAAVRRALGIGEADTDDLLAWLRDSRVAWGLDAQHKAALGLPPRPEHSFAWAMDRMLAGYLMADATDPTDDAVMLDDGTVLLPVGGIHGPSAAALGALDRLLCELQAWHDLAGAELAASAWTGALRARVDALLRVEATDAEGCAALAVLHHAIEQLAAEPASNGLDPMLRLAVVRVLLRDAMAAAPGRQRFLMGGITFCGMVPQRSVPFDLVAVLGLDEGRFPRRPADGGLDLMTVLRRTGDRDAPTDDRYLFLETLMAARRRLHLSYIGQGIRDAKPRNPAGPLAELLAELDHHAGIRPGDAVSRPWLVRHPLQPFDARYFDGSDRHPALFSYSAAFAAMRGDGSRPAARLRDDAPLPAEPLPDPLPLRRLEGFFKDPARALLQDELQVSLAALDDSARLLDEEPLAGIPRLVTAARRVFLRDVLPRRCIDPTWPIPAAPPDWLQHGGLLPLGTAADTAWATEMAAIDALWNAAAALDRFDGRAGDGGRTLRIEVALDDAALRISGAVSDVFPLRGSDAGLQLVRAYPDGKGGLKQADAIGLRDLVPAFLHWALLRLQQQAAAPGAPVRLTLLAKGDEPTLAARANAWDEHFCAADAEARRILDIDLRRRLRGLVALWERGRRGASKLYPRTASAALRGRRKGADLEAWAVDAAKQAVAAWVGSDDRPGERDDAPGYARWLERDLAFGDPGSDAGLDGLRALLADAEQVEALILLAVADDAPALAERAG